MNGTRLFRDVQRETVTAILNCLIPPDGERPGAGEANGSGALEDVLDHDAGLRRSFLDWLVEVDLTSWRHHAAAFAELDVDVQTEVLTTVERADPGTFDVVVRLAFRGYYENPGVLDALGIDPRPPQPRGYTLPAFDAAQLDRVRKRGKRFRDAPA